MWKYATNGSVESTPAVADLFGNGKLEVIVGSWDGGVYCLNGTTGSKLWSYTTGIGIAFSFSFAVADLFGNGNLEVIVGSVDHNIYCLGIGNFSTIVLVTVAAVVVAAAVVVIVAAVFEWRKRIAGSDHKT